MYSLSDICSLCLERNSTFQSILSKDIDGIVVQEKLKVFLLELVNYKPHIQKYICDKCLANLNFIHKFRQTCLENIGSLDKYVQKLELPGTCENLSVIQKAYQQSNITVKKEVIEEENEHEFHENTNFMEESNESNSPEKEKEICIEQVFVKTEPYDDFQEFNEENNITEESGNITSNKITTSTGRKNISERSNQNATENKSKLTENPIKFTTPKDGEILRKMLIEKGTTSSTSSDGKNITEESNPNAIEMNYKCTECPKTFTRFKYLTRHRYTHTEQYTCKTCHKSYSRSEDLRRHSQTHTGVKAFVCGVCGKAFHLRHTLHEHERIHSNVRPFECSVCKMAFTRSGNLNDHMRKHTGNKPYECSKCPKTFARRGSLVAHLRKHSGDKPFPCHLCRHQCASGNDLKAHLEAHTFDKPHACDVCDMRFAVLNKLERHKRTHNKV